jgi:hypothetical protein
VQVIAFSTPRAPDWRWRIVNGDGEMVEESARTFASIANAVAEGAKRMRDLDVVPDRIAPARGFTYGRRH